MEVAIVSDSHVPSRASTIPTPFRRRIQSADHVLHAGDFDSAAALSTFEDLATAYTAVSGNMDRDLGLPSVATVELESVHFVLTHGTGSPAGYRHRVASTAEDAATGQPIVGVAGHTHDVMDSELAGIRLLNPGSVTGAPPASQATMMRATVVDGTLDVTVHEL